MAENTVECPYHGWRFPAHAGGPRSSALGAGEGAAAACGTLIPSLVEGQAIDPAKTRVRSYPVREQDGLIWLYFASDERKPPSPSVEPPRVGIPDPMPRWVESQTFHCGIDHAVIGLMDPAHAP